MRTSAGVHTNPYHLTSTVVQHAVEMTYTPVLVDLHVLANISQAQLLLTQLLAGLYPGQQQQTKVMAYFDVYLTGRQCSSRGVCNS